MLTCKENSFVLGHRPSANNRSHTAPINVDMKFSEPYSWASSMSLILLSSETSTMVAEGSLLSSSCSICTVARSSLHHVRNFWESPKHVYKAPHTCHIRQVVLRQQKWYPGRLFTAVPSSLKLAKSRYPTVHRLKPKLIVLSAYRCTEIRAKLLYETGW